MNPSEAPPANENVGEDQGVALDLQPTGNLQEDIAAGCAQGLAVDDDNEPAPENVPTATTHHCSIYSLTGLLHGQYWNWNGICNHKATTRRRASESFHHWMPTDDSFIDVILHWMPVDFLENTMVVGTSESLKKAGETEISWVSFLFSLDSGFLWQLSFDFPIEISSAHVKTMRKSSLSLPSVAVHEWTQL